MKLTPRFMIRAALVVTAGGVIGFFGACKGDVPVAPSPAPPPPPPPPPPTVAAPSAVTATPAGATQINLAWTDNATNETGFRVERCGGAGCSNFAQVGTDLAANTVAYTDVGLTANTLYNYRVRAFNATAVSAYSDIAPATTAAISNSFTMVGAGEISTCNSDAGPRATAALVKGILDAEPEAIAFTVGNNLGDLTAGTTFQDCFAGKGWDDAAYKARTWYGLGNGDFGTDRGPTAVYGFFGDRAGPAHKGWFSFDKGSWHIVMLNTSDWEHGRGPTYGITSDPTDPTGARLIRVPSEQVDWLSADLAANTKPCVAVISWERRFYTTGTSALGRQTNMLPMGNIMYANGVDLIISAKDKLYERFAPMNPENGTADATRGIRQFIVGTGGRSSDVLPPGVVAEREAAFAGQWGVLKLTLGDGNYSWEFKNTIPGGVTDKSAAPVPCH